VLSEHLPERGGRILDAGCGFGRLPLYWRRWSSPGQTASLVGIEVSPSRLELARTRGYQQLIRSDLASPWPLADRAFDAVVCEQVLEHFDDATAGAVLSEVFRVLEPGGLALVGVPVFRELTRCVLPAPLALRARWRSLLGRPQAAHLQHFTIRRLGALVRDHGFSVESARGFRVLSLPRNWLEDFEWYYRLHQWLGGRFPALCTEVTLVCRRPADPSPLGAASFSRTPP
jgi:SAM-dependent methyltransferase